MVEPSEVDTSLVAVPDAMESLSPPRWQRHTRPTSSSSSTTLLITTSLRTWPDTGDIIHILPARHERIAALAEQVQKDGIITETAMVPFRIDQRGHLVVQPDGYSEILGQPGDSEIFGPA